MASLQLDNQHICSSGLFKKGFLLTTAACAWQIKSRMKRKGQTATAVLGDINLNKGKRTSILDAAFDSLFEITEQSCLNNLWDYGVVMVRSILL